MYWYSSFYSIYGPKSEIIYHNLNIFKYMVGARCSFCTWANTAGRLWRRYFNKKNKKISLITLSSIRILKEKYPKLPVPSQAVNYVSICLEAATYYAEHCDAIKYVNVLVTRLWSKDYPKWENIWKRSNYFTALVSLERITKTQLNSKLRNADRAAIRVEYSDTRVSWCAVAARQHHQREQQ